MDEDTQEIINVPLTIWEVRKWISFQKNYPYIRYYLYNTINKDNMYTSNYMDFLKNLFKKFDIVLAELEQPNTIHYLSEVKDSVKKKKKK